MSSIFLDRTHQTVFVSSKQRIHQTETIFYTPSFINFKHLRLFSYTFSIKIKKYISLHVNINKTGNFAKLNYNYNYTSFSSRHLFCKLHFLRISYCTYQEKGKNSRAIQRQYTYNNTETIYLILLSNLKRNYLITKIL